MARRNKDDAPQKDYDGYANIVFTISGGTKEYKLGGIALREAGIPHKLLLELAEEINDGEIVIDLSLKINDLRDAEEDESIEDILLAARAAKKAK